MKEANRVDIFSIPASGPDPELGKLLYEVSEAAAGDPHDYHRRFLGRLARRVSEGPQEPSPYVAGLATGGPAVEVMADDVSAADRAVVGVVLAAAAARTAAEGHPAAERLAAVAAGKWTVTVS
jgi:hypothetical protein